MASRHLSPQSYPTSLEDAFCIKRAPVSRDRTLCLLRKSNSVSLRQFRNPLFPTTIPSASCISSKFLNTKDWYSKPGFDFLNPRFSLARRSTAKTARIRGQFFFIRVHLRGLPYGRPVLFFFLGCGYAALRPFAFIRGSVSFSLLP